MQINVAGSPEDENKMEEFSFRVSFSETGFLLHFCRFRQYERESEFEDWILQGEYLFPDILNRSTLLALEVPPWAKQDAKSKLLDLIEFHE